MNPILQSRSKLYLYLLAWVIVSVIQASILSVFFELDIDLAAIDSLVFNIVFLIFGLLIWYPVRYMPLSNRNIYSIVLNHLALGIVVIASWISSGFFLMKALMSGNEDIMERLILSVPYRIISGILLYMLILLVYYLIVYSNNLKEKIRNESRLQTLVREAELNMLKSQINPHFLFNSLNSVSSLTLKDPASAREMIIKLSEYLRYSLRHSETEKTLLKDEVDNIRRYLEIEKIRFGKRLNFTLTMDESAIDWPVPNMILQPLFENAIKHGVYESTEPVTIEMKAETSFDKLHIEIRNNFDSESPVRKGAGIGLKNIRDRLLLLYDKEDLLMYQNEDKVFIVKLLIPNYENTRINN